MTKVIDAPLLKISRRFYKEYGLATLEDRAIADYRDGFGPVHRRSLWAAHELGLRSTAKLVKSARIVGDTLGKYHPHGDGACYGAIVGLANKWVQVPLFEGHGNWGSLTDPSFAAHRYTEARLSKFSDEVLFNKFYLPVIQFVPNYDSSSVEPLVLPALLPTILINGHFGIATAATAKIPSFKYRSVLKLLRSIYEGAAIEPKLLYKTLEFRTVFGGQERDLTDSAAKQARMSVFKAIKGKVSLYSNPAFDAKTRTVKATKFAINKMESVLGKMLALDGVAAARDDSTKNDKYGELNIVMRKGLDAKAQAKLLKRIDHDLSVDVNFNLNFTERYVDPEGQGQAAMKPMCLVDMLTEWVKWRTDLEKRACQHWVDQAAKEIRRLELLMLAVDNRKLIIESLDKDLSQDDLEIWLAKKLKITKEEAHTIYQLRVIQLRKLERKSLEAEMKEVKTRKVELEQRKKTPEPHMAKQLESFVKLVEKEV